MRAIFKIPNSPPPTLPEPHKYTKPFHDFLAACLQKDPALRPSADQLLRTSPFILAAKSKAVIASLVAECMPAIEEYRQADTEGDEGGDDQGAAGGTMVAKSKSSKKKSAEPEEFDSGTMVQKPGGAGAAASGEEDDGGGFGTMVVAKGDEKKATPEYLKGDEKKSNGAGGEKKGGAYKTGKALEVGSHTSAKDLSTSLKELDKAAEEELAAVQAFYEDRKKKVKTLLAQKEAEAKAAAAAAASLGTAAPAPASAAAAAPAKK